MESVGTEIKGRDKGPRGMVAEVKADLPLSNLDILPFVEASVLSREGGAGIVWECLL